MKYPNNINSWQQNHRWWKQTLNGLLALESRSPSLLLSLLWRSDCMEQMYPNVRWTNPQRVWYSLDQSCLQKSLVSSSISSDTHYNLTMFGQLSAIYFTGYFHSWPSISMIWLYYSGLDTTTTQSASAVWLDSLSYTSITFSTIFPHFFFGRCCICHNVLYTTLYYNTLKIQDISLLELIAAACDNLFHTWIVTVIKLYLPICLDILFQPIKYLWLSIQYRKLSHTLIQERVV